MDFILGILVAPWVLWAVLGLCLLFDLGNSRSDDYSGWAAVWFFVLVVIGAARLLTADVQVTIPMIAGAVVVYLLIGSMWSLWRYRSMILHAKDSIRDAYENPEYIRKAMHELKHRTRAGNYVGFIVFHMVAFPISFVTHVFGDVYRMFMTFVRRYMVGIFNTVHAKLFKDIE